jgi:hypothetical protein
LKIGKATVARSAICTSNEDTIVVRGADLSRDLIGHINFGDYFFLLRDRTHRADAATSAVLNATLVAIAEHGLVPSNQAARMTYAAAPEAMQGAVAAGLAGRRLGGLWLVRSGRALVPAGGTRGQAAWRRHSRGRPCGGQRLARQTPADSRLRPPRAQRARPARGCLVQCLAQSRCIASATSRLPRPSRA